MTLKKEEEEDEEEVQEDEEEFRKWINLACNGGMIAVQLFFTHSSLYLSFLMFFLFLSV